jgi:pimeloyl-ACP methyl ester carboxylesterase
MMHSAPGRLIEIGAGQGGCRLHLHQQGAGAPAVVLESGIAGSSLSWSLVQPKIAEFTRVCSYDRAGLGWSDPCTEPRTVPRMVSELATLLERANVPPPYILVGHSFGGLLIRAYAHLRPQEVAGLVFVDPVSLETWASCAPRNRERLNLGIRLSRRGALLARLGLVRFALWTLASGGRRFPKLIAKATAQRGASTIERLTGEIKRLPPEVWPIIRGHWSRPKSFQAMAEYLECLPGAAASALSMPLPANLPVTILSASDATEAELQERDSWLHSQRNAAHLLLPNSKHWIPLEQPNEVAAAVKRLLDQITPKKGGLAEDPSMCVNLHVVPPEKSGT